MAAPTDPPVLPARARMTGAADEPPHGGVAPAAGRPTPPPRPSQPPPLQPQPPKKAPAGFADLPDLPPMPSSAVKRNLTLVGMMPTLKGPTSRRGRRLWVSISLAGLIVMGVSAVYRRALVDYFLPTYKRAQVTKPMAVAPVLTPQQQAARALEVGSEAYAARDYGRAVASFEQALNLDPTLSDAHRALGIVHADLHDDAEAIAHYQKYVEMVPQAQDAPRVKKIIDDYRLAHAPPAVAPGSAAAPLPAAPISAAHKPEHKPAHKTNKHLRHKPHDRKNTSPGGP